jgi:HAD superfamily hydrolase (TIGR01450 family)
MNLKDFQAILLDLDGTLYHEEHPLPGAVELVHDLQRQNIPFACLSNSTTSGLRLSQRLARMGIQADPNHIYTAAEAAADYILDHFPQREPMEPGHPRPGPLSEASPPRPAPRIFNLATEGIEELLADKAIFIQSAAEPCDLVIAGAPANVYATEPRQRIALQLLRGGASLIGICADRVYPSPKGIEFGSGAFCAYLGYAANTAPTFCGKPQPIFFHKLCEKLKVNPANCLLIGDNLESDIAGGRGVGMKTILVLTGVTPVSQLENLPLSQTPDHIIQTLRDLV